MAKLKHRQNELDILSEIMVTDGETLDSVSERVGILEHLVKDNSAQAVHAAQHRF